MVSTSWIKKKLHPGIWRAISPLTGRTVYIARMRIPGGLFCRTCETYHDAIQARYEGLMLRPPIQPHRKAKKVLEPIRQQRAKQRLRKKAYENAATRPYISQRQEHQDP